MKQLKEKKKMKKAILTTLCILFAATTICTAQNNNDEKKSERQAKRQEMIKKRTERMKNELSLTNEQAAKVEALNNEYLPKMRKARHHKRPTKGNLTSNSCCNKQCTASKCCKEETKCCNTNVKCGKSDNSANTFKADASKHKNNMGAKRKEYIEKLNEILTPEQQEKYKSLRKEKREKERKRTIK